MSLATFVHISDLHIAPTKKRSFNARRQAWKRWDRFQGLLGHSANSLVELDEFFDAFLQNEKESEVQLIVTGDLTATGAPKEFYIANQYLGGILQGDVGEQVGLEAPDWSDRAIPGNHDHWPGRPTIIGRSTLSLYRYFPHLPRIGPVVQLGGRHQLRFVRIDTDANVGSFSWERIGALGSFESQLVTLSGLLGKLGPNDNEIRVLCLHHSLSYRGNTLEIIEPSRTALNEFIVQNKIAVLLCGHIHRPPWVNLFAVVSGTGIQLEVVEACCGTTTQYDPSIGRKSEPQDAYSHWENSLFVHRLLDRHGQIHWETELYLEGRGGFVRADSLRDDIPAVSISKVWPWPPNPI
jgi:3',5'-cyclic AMP phosphodiesterase CpdA